MWCYNSSWVMPWGWIAFLVVIIVVAGIVIPLAVRNQKGSTGASSETALEIAEKRYAKGEITKGQFESIKNDLLR